MIGAVKDAVSSVASAIKSFLHFSVPDEGPLTDYESWMPDFMHGLAKGIDKSKSAVEKAIDGVASSMNLDGVIPVSYTHLDVYKRQRVDGKLILPEAVQILKLKSE